VAEAAARKVEPLARDLENLVRIEVLGKRLAAVQAERNAPMVLVAGGTRPAIDR